MHEFAISSSGPTDTLYKDLASAAEALVADEPDHIANMANISALIWQYLPDLNWAGFYRVIEDELVLGPFQGKTACIRIAIGKGVCGTAAVTGEAQRVADVHAFPGHIACDADSRSELVLPVKHDGKVVAVLDLDSPSPDRFSMDDQTGLETLINSITPALMSKAE
ncbi:GAF domain-containing protein [Parasphingorhabdus sp.]|uniref:GAF domain-containing protein n=1 Tax=Parasphingorhabdus sp. TaxID=2709688 RepID=UPI003263DAB2